MCSHPGRGDTLVTDETITEKNCEEYNELNFLRQNHGHHRTPVTQQVFKETASPSQAKNHSM